MNWICCCVIALAVVIPATAQQPANTPAKRVGLAESKGAPNANAPARAVGCGCELPLPEVVAVVNGIKISKQDFSPETQKRVSEFQDLVVTARKRELELQINSLLLEAEAKRLKISSYQLLQNEVVAKTTEPTEAEAQKFYDENRARINRDFPAVKTDIIAYLRDGRQRELASKLADRLRGAANVQVLVAEVTPPANASDRNRLFATVNGQRITSAEIEDSLLPLIFSVQEQSYGVLKSELDVKINDILLTNEAQKRQVTTRALLEAEVDNKVALVTEAQAQKFYNENKERINGDFEKVKGQLITYLKDQEAQRLSLAYSGRLRQAAPLSMFLTPPVAPVLKIAIDDQPSKGGPNATVTIIEFTDFQCPSCAQSQSVLDKLLVEYGQRLRVVVRDFPLNRHEHAMKAAEAAEAARAQGKYWEYTALLYANQSALGKDQLKEYATRVGLDRTRFDAAIDGGTYSELVLRDMRDGDRVGVVGTPAFFVNGRRVTEPTYEGLKASIEAALKSTR